MTNRASVRLAPGEGLVACTGSALLVLPAAADPALVAVFMEARDGEQLDAVTEFAEEAGADLVPFACVSWARRIRVVVFGEVTLTTDHPSLPMMSGAGSGTWVERTLAKLGQPVTVEVNTTVGSVDAWTDLRHGIVRAAGGRVEVTTGGDADEPVAHVQMDVAGPIETDRGAPTSGVLEATPSARPPAEEVRAVEADTAADEPPCETERIPANHVTGAPDAPRPEPGGARSSADVLAESLLGDIWRVDDVDPPATPPMPIRTVPSSVEIEPIDEELTYVPAALPAVHDLAAAARGNDDSWTGRPMVEAANCPSCAAPNPVTASRCQVCDGLLPPLLPAGLVARPVLGRVVFDDGSIEQLDIGVLIGRNPRTEESLEDCRIVKVGGEKLSRLHLEIRLHDWDVYAIDRGSTNGTFVVPYLNAAPLKLEPEVMHRLEPGALVLFGTRTFRVDGRRQQT